MKILAFAATNSTNSINKELLGFALNQIKEQNQEHTIEVIDLKDFQLPIYSIDDENTTGIPEAAKKLFAKIGTADRLLISFAEHNGTTTAVWKNTFDWLSRIDSKLWQNKPMVILAASPGGRAGQGVLANQKVLAPHFGGKILASRGVGNWYDNWNQETQSLTNQSDKEAVSSAVAKLIK